MSKLCLIIVDGFGVAPEGPGNARAMAKMPFLASLKESTPHVLTHAAGSNVGLPDGQQGASEPGHLTIGAGRIVWQPLEEINQAITQGSFFENKVLVDACERAVEKDVPLHLIGIYSIGGVHGFVDHVHAMVDLAKQKGVKHVYIHLFGDGRDTAEQQFCTDFKLLEEHVTKAQLGTIASLVGRYFAMDRDKQYAERTKIAYDLLTAGEGKEMADLCEGAKSWYLEAKDTERTDYYIRPLKTPDFHPIAAEDVVVCTNFRSDRMIQIVRALEAEDFTEFPRPVRIADVVCMGPYSDHLPVAFPPLEIKNNLGEAVSNAGKKQVRIAETDKFAHVTFFFNSQRQEPYKGETRILVESPKVSNFAEAPAMNAEGVTRVAMEQAANEDVDFIVMNYANPDLVGHGGKIDAVVTACETVDKHLAELIPALEEHGYDWIMTADHGNAEEMYYPGTDTICPSHTTNMVETYVHSDAITDDEVQQIQGLKDIAPLCLKIMDISVPEEMK